MFLNAGVSQWSSMTVYIYEQGCTPCLPHLLRLAEVAYFIQHHTLKHQLFRHSQAVLLHVMSTCCLSSPTQCNKGGFIEPVPLAGAAAPLSAKALCRLPAPLLAAAVLVFRVLSPESFDLELRRVVLPTSAQFHVFPSQRPTTNTSPKKILTIFFTFFGRCFDYPEKVGDKILWVSWLSCISHFFWEMKVGNNQVGDIQAEDNRGMIKWENIRREIIMGLK